MGLLDEALGNAAPGGNLTKPLMIALGTLVVGKMLHSGSSAGASTEPSNTDTSSPSLQPSVDAANADGGLLGGLGGLINKLEAAGHGDTVNSWVGPGQNKPIEPGHLKSALGQETIQDIAKQSGMSEQELLTQLAVALPGIIDKLTPNGKIPNLQQLAAAFMQR